MGTPTAHGDGTGFEGWAVLELMGHRRLAGFVREATLAGGSFLRIDVPKDPGPGEDEPQWAATQFYPPSSVYCLTPCSEETARGVARKSQVEPVTEYDVKPRPALPARTVVDVEPDDEPEDDDGRCPDCGSASDEPCPGDCPSAL